jgi:hypothetical protein
MTAADFVGPAPRGGAACLLALALAGCDQPATPPPAATATPLVRELPDHTIVLVVPRTTPSAGFPALAKAQCGSRSPCTLRAWVSPADAPTALPLTETQVMTQAFSYISNRVTGFELSQWNCLMYQRTNRAQCMPDLED